MVGDKKAIRCRDCKRVIRVHCRGLCRTCYGKPGAKELYPHLSVQGERCGRRTEPLVSMRLPEVGTDAPAGSEEKIAVMTERIGRKEHLHHPDDSIVITEGICTANVGRGKGVKSVYEKRKQWRRVKSGA